LVKIGELNPGNRRIAIAGWGCVGRSHLLTLTGLDVGKFYIADLDVCGVWLGADRTVAALAVGPARFIGQR
jgi:hypothetical protein